MIDVSDVLAADRQVEAVGGSGNGVRMLVGTVSHCHGALGVLTVGKLPRLEAV
jgi:hypothetical protein